VEFVRGWRASVASSEIDGQVAGIFHHVVIFKKMRELRFFKLRREAIISISVLWEENCSRFFIYL
jgi:hypothetical protein